MKGNYSKPDPCFLEYALQTKLTHHNIPVRTRENTFQLMLSAFYCISLTNLIALIFVMDKTTQFELVVSEGRH